LWGTGVVLVYPLGFVPKLWGRFKMGGVRNSFCFLYPSIIATLRPRNGRKALAYPYPSQR
jgi:hypothetical protein